MTEAFRDPYNAAYAQELYEAWLRDPTSVDERWRRIFATPEAAGLLAAPASEGRPTAARSDEVRAARAAAELVDAYRLVGHFAARLDPLGTPPQGHPMLEPSYHDVDPGELQRGPTAELLGDVLGWLRDTYAGTIGYEFEHIEDPERREWLRQRIETGAHLQPLSAEQQRRLLERLTEVEALEQFLHKAYLGQKRFSIEGLDMMVPVLDLAIERAAAEGAREVVMGMAHRGRLNVLAHVLGRPAGLIIGEFEGRHTTGGGTGDVKYHLGAEGTYATASGEPLTVTLAPNPSHLEFVNPVVEGITRAKQEDRSGRAVAHDGSLVLPIIMHGDAAFSAQGVVAETLNMAELRGYATGGTLHIVANNQVGFTTDPRDARSTYYASDLALGFNIPVFHVNADDPGACLAVARLALAYRTRFAADVVIDLVGYRRYGHNEGDEPAYTQPLQYDVIAQHPTARTLWLRTLVEAGALSEEEGEAIWDAAYERLVQSQKEVKSELDDGHENGPPAPDEPEKVDTDTAVDAERVRALDRALHSWPDGFEVHPKLGRQLERRAKGLAEGDGPVDWAHAEALSFASLVADGTPVRLTGQDSERGTFSQRHLILHDVKSGSTYCPIGHMEEARAPFVVHNSPLSEVGVLGFEYGYSTAAEDTLVLWEAQFGDFANGAQVIIDQFIASGRAKWRQDAGVVMLLPHGYEGQGPEHSSARIERFLQLAAEDNLRVANCTTPAQYFHLLRRQARLKERRPLVIFTPKSLLRHPRAVSTLPDLAEDGFHAVLDDARGDEGSSAITRVVLCSGKVYYDLLAQQEEDEHGAGAALARVEQLYPFPAAELTALLERYPDAEEVVWAQEEPMNMGPWRFMEPRIHRLAGGRRVRYVGRPERASTAEGFLRAHQAEQKRIVREAFAAGVPAKR